MKILFLMAFLYSLAFSNSMVHFEKGWSLVGLANTLSNMDKFNNPNVEVVWGFDATNQLWQGYSPDKTLSQKISDNNLSTLSAIQSYQAFWILSKESWSFELQESSLNAASNNTIVLKKGWNLVSLSQEVIASNNFFEDDLVWKYSQEWSVNDSSLDFPSLKDIKKSEGLWVKSEDNREIDIAQTLSKLQTFNTESQMLEYIRAMIKSNNYFHPYIFDGEITTLDMVATEEVSSDTKSADATTTNLQESGVDESDILKHDGVNIYSVDNANSQIFITSFENIAVKNYKAINQISTSNKTVISMYLQSSRLILISNNNRYYDDKELVVADSISSSYINSQSITIDIYDISDVKDIRELTSYKLDGRYSDSRLVDGKLFFISSFYPQINYEYPKIYDDNGAYTYDYENPIVIDEKLIPTIITNNKESNLLLASKFYAPIKLNQSSNITTISSFNVANAEYEESISFVGNTHTTYMSQSSLYLLSREYPFYFNYSDYKEQEMIYKFSFNDTLKYVGRGFVDGRVLNQFSLSEKDEYLRVATTSGFSWGSSDTDNSVYTLKSDNEALKIEGTLSGLGKSGETIQAVRFMDDRGFVVTFKQTDPLYTLDLSDPKNPKKVGELSIPGFSRYLHIVDENRVLSIGRDADEITGVTLGLQLQLFDVSDFENPQLVDKIKVGDRYTHSSAEYNHKAFTYRASDLMFGLPFTTYNHLSSENFGIYQIENMSINAVETLSKTASDNYWGSNQRGVIFDLNASSYGVLIDGSNILSDKIK